LVGVGIDPLSKKVLIFSKTIGSESFPYLPSLYQIIGLSPTMVGGWRLWILFVQGILLLAMDWRGLAQGPDCWETCFEPANRNDQYKDEYRDVN
jgi:hypothetical protein